MIIFATFTFSKVPIRIFITWSIEVIYKRYNLLRRIVEHPNICRVWESEKTYIFKRHVIIECLQRRNSMLKTTKSNVARKPADRDEIILDSCSIFFINKSQRRLPSFRKETES